MTDEETIELVAEHIDGPCDECNHRSKFSHLCLSKTDPCEGSKDKARELLDLRGDCPTCGGTGSKYATVSITDCPDCIEHPGKGERVLFTQEEMRKALNELTFELGDVARQETDKQIEQAKKEERERIIEKLTDICTTGQRTTAEKALAKDLILALILEDIQRGKVNG